MSQDTPFGHRTRMRVLEKYLVGVGEIADENAWEHVYRCLLWINQGTGLAHIYDSNHMQLGGVFHGRAVRFTELLCQHWQITVDDLPDQIDFLFKGCVEEWRQWRSDEAHKPAKVENKSELISQIKSILKTEGISEERVPEVAQRIQALSRDFFTIGNKRKNALGEGFEDLLTILLQRVSKIPAAKLQLRTPVSKLPGFRRVAPSQKGDRRKREPRPDIAIVEGNITHVIATAKWSMRQDRETQFQSEYSSFQMNKVQPTELSYALITNEFDLARLKNVARAMPGGAGGYIFHDIYHICLPLLRDTHGDRFREIEPWVGTGKLKSLSDFLAEMRGRFGEE